MSMADRPARPPRGKLSPPADADIDPIDARPTRPTGESASPDKGTSRPTRTASPSAPSARTAAAAAINMTVQSGVSWSPETEQLVRDAKARTGKTRRAVVEEAIAAMWSV